MKIMIAILLFILSNLPANSDILKFNGVSGRSNFNEVKEKFYPHVFEATICALGEKTSVFADGVSLCKYLQFQNYRLLGRSFDTSFFFYEDGGLKTINLLFPPIRAGKKGISPNEAEGLYWDLVDLFASKYGESVRRPICSYLVGEFCREWRADKQVDKHTGGETIVIKYDGPPAFSPRINITYSFRNRTSFGKF